VAWKQGWGPDFVFLQPGRRHQGGGVTAEAHQPATHDGVLCGEDVCRRAAGVSTRAAVCMCGYAYVIVCVCGRACGVCVSNACPRGGLFSGMHACLARGRAHVRARMRALVRAAQRPGCCVLCAGSETPRPLPRTCATHPCANRAQLRRHPIQSPRSSPRASPSAARCSAPRQPRTLKITQAETTPPSRPRHASRQGGGGVV
jgi:hypothetical protein